MGCFDSKMDAKRKALADDWTGSEYAFAVGGIASLDEFCPLDKLAIKFCGGEGKELKDGIGELADAKLAEDKAKELGNKIFEALKKLHGDFKADKDEDKKVFGKYTAKEAFEQIDGAVKLWCEKSGLEHKLGEDAAATAPEGMEMAAAMGDEAMEGGEGDAMMMGDMMGAAAAAPKRDTPEVSAFGDMAGPAEIPKLLLCMMVCFPAFGDAVKAQILDCEFGGSGSDDLGAVATVVGAFVDAGEKADSESWGCAWCTDDEVEELKAAFAAKDTKALVFPGTVVAWDSKDTAVGCAGEAPDGKKKVVFKFNGKVLKPAGDKAIVFHRQFAKMTECKDEDGALLVELADFTEATFATVKEWSDKVKVLADAAAAGGAAVADAAMDAAMMDPPMDPPME